VVDNLAPNAHDERDEGKKACLMKKSEKIERRKT